MKRPEEIFEDHELADQKREAKIKEQFEEITGIEPTRIDQAFPFDRHVHIHTEDRTWNARLTEGGKQLVIGSIQEETFA